MTKPSKTFIVPVKDVPSKQESIQSQKAQYAYIDALANKPWNIGTFIDTAIAITPGVENWVEHGLGRMWQGWEIVDIDAPAIVFRVAPSVDVDETKYLVLNATMGVRVKLKIW